MNAARVLYTVLEVIFNIIGLLLGGRILLRFFGANPSTPFVNWMYDIKAPLISPFAGIFPDSIVAGNFTVDVAAVFALIVYALIGFAILSLVQMIQYRINTYDDYHHAHAH